jgi:predicted AAA+ superfamily ATPase
MEELVNISNRLINRVSFNFQRSLLNSVDWSQRLIEIRGSRGVGKTTLMLQQAKRMRESGAVVLYVSLDLPHFYSNYLFDFVQSFTQHGGSYLFLDEIHRYPSKHKESDWSLELKNIYDSFPDLHIIYSGSSILHLYKGQGDLSRRKASYLMNGLSFREYLELNKIAVNPSYDLETILKDHVSISTEVSSSIKPLLHFKNYLKTGYYPFYSGKEDVYFRQLQDVINLIIDTDLPYLASISQSGKEQLKRLLGAISSTVPYTPNMNKLAELIHITDHRTLMKYLQLLDEAQIIQLIRSNSKGNKQLQKPEKILINNTNLMFALGLYHTEVGTLRETFFCNQISYKHNLNYSKIGDFIVNERFIVEIGGKSKGFKQLGTNVNSFVVSDEIEIGFGNKIPLWLFGFLY